MADGNGQYPPELLSKYPHMFPLDIAIWERFIAQFGANYLGFDYDVKIGSGTQPVEGLGPEYTRMQEVLSKYRIDAVGYTNSTITIFEVKPDARKGAVGQIELYSKLYRRDLNPTRTILGAIVTDREMPDIRYMTEEKAWQYFILPAPDQEQQALADNLIPSPPTTA